MSTDPSPDFGSVDRLEVPAHSFAAEARSLDEADPLAHHRDAFGAKLAARTAP